MPVKKTKEAVNRGYLFLFEVDFFAVFLAAGFFAAFLATGFLTAFLAAGFFAATFLAAGFLTAFLAAGFFAATFLAAGFLTAFLAAGFLTAFLAAGFLTAFLAAGFLTAFLAAGFFRVGSWLGVGSISKLMMSSMLNLSKRGGEMFTGHRFLRSENRTSLSQKVWPWREFGQHRQRRRTLAEILEFEFLFCKRTSKYLRIFEVQGCAYELLSLLLLLSIGRMTLPQT